MTLCFPYRTRDALALLLGTCLLPGCVDPKTIGLETDDEGSGDASGTDGQTEGMTSVDPDTAGSDSDGGTDGSDGSGSDGTLPCPPIDVQADCVTCECLDGSWACSTEACVYDCGGVDCGVECLSCPEEDPECTAPEHQGICTLGGECALDPETASCDAAIVPGFEMSLTESGGCGDMNVYALNPADTQGIVLYLDDGVVATASASGMPHHAEYLATDVVVSLEVRAGIDVTSMECQDVVVPGIDIQELWLPTAGTVIVDVTPSGMAEGFATVQFVDLVIEREQPGPAPVAVPSLVIEDVFVGWLPG